MMIIHVVSLRMDPSQLKNLVGGLEDGTKAKLLARLHELWKCAGEECA
jgi:hypothetical protein